MRSGRGLWPWVAAGLALLIGSVVWLVLTWVQQPTTGADPLASVLGFLLAVAGAVVGVGGWAARRRRDLRLPADAEQINRAAATLANVVREQWTAEGRVRALGDPGPMPVRWRLVRPPGHPEAVDPAGPVAFSGRSDRIDDLAAAFDALPRRRLVITGGPGTGKTTLAVQLLLALLPVSGEPPSGPVPVLFSLASWDPAERPRVQDWLTEQLELTYPVLAAISANAATGLVEQDRLLPILDGLDEVPAERAAAIIGALNASLTGGVVLTSRRPEYRAATTHDRLTAAAVIAPLALSGEAAAGYLRRHLPPDADPAWRQVLARLAPATGAAPTSGAGAALARLVATPLGLWLVRTVYVDSRRDPTALTDPAVTLRELRARLLEQLIPAVVATRPPPGRRYSGRLEGAQRPRRAHRPDDVRRLLTAVATQMRDAGARDWCWWRLADYTCPTRRARVLLRARLVLANTVTLTLGTVIAMAAFGVVWRGDPITGAETGLVLGAPLGLALGLMMGSAVSLGAAPSHIDRRLRGRGRRPFARMAVTLVVLLAVGLVIGILTGQLVRGLAFGVTVGLLAGLPDLLASTDVAARSLSPEESFRGARTQVLVVGLGVGLPAGLMVGLVTDIASTTADVGLAFGLAFGLLVTGIALFLFVSISAWWVFGACIFRASHTATRPGRTMAVLEDCHRLGLLRVVGPIYQFRHAELQDHLAPPSTA